MILDHSSHPHFPKEEEEKKEKEKQLEMETIVIKKEEEVVIVYKHKELAFYVIGNAKIEFPCMHISTCYVSLKEKCNQFTNLLDEKKIKYVVEHIEDISLYINMFGKQNYEEMYRSVHFYDRIEIVKKECLTFKDEKSKKFILYVVANLEKEEDLISAENLLKSVEDTIFLDTKDEVRPKRSSKIVNNIITCVVKEPKKYKKLYNNKLYNNKYY